MGKKYIVLKIEEPTAFTKYENFIIAVNHDLETNIHRGHIPDEADLIDEFVLKSRPEEIDEELRLIVTPMETTYEQILRPNAFSDFDWVDVSTLNTAEWYEMEDEDWAIIHKFLTYYFKHR